MTGEQQTDPAPQDAWLLQIGIGVFLFGLLISFGLLVSSIFGLGLEDQIGYAVEDLIMAPLLALGGLAILSMLYKIIWGRDYAE